MKKKGVVLIKMMIKKNMNQNMLKQNLNFYFMMQKVIHLLLNAILKLEELIKLEYI